MQLQAGSAVGKVEGEKREGGFILKELEEENKEEEKERECC